MAESPPPPEAPSGAAPSQDPVGEVTLLLQRISAAEQADPADGERLLELAYGALRRLAATFLAVERTDHTLQPTALVHEAWLRLVDQERVEWSGRAHFMAIAAQAMRRILVDHARGRAREKRGGAWRQVELDAGLLAPDDERGVDLLALDVALERLAASSERQARVVELRFFGGLSMEQVAEVLGTSLSTVEREWRFARVWLLHAIQDAS
jgi:RNA polymerase sigma factor (TIGR02999 family)